jgi:hypothetical protein
MIVLFTATCLLQVVNFISVSIELYKHATPLCVMSSVHPSFSVMYLCGLFSKVVYVQYDVDSSCSNLNMEVGGVVIEGRNRGTQEYACPNDTLTTGTDKGSNPGFSFVKSTTT